MILFPAKEVEGLGLYKLLKSIREAADNNRYEKETETQEKEEM